MEFVKAFIVGGVICALVQILMDNTKLMPGRIMVLLVVSGTILGALGLYQPFADWAGAGATVPLLGFGNTLWKGVWKSMGGAGLRGALEAELTAGPAGTRGGLILDIWGR